jgi:hypothetical protein
MAIQVPSLIHHRRDACNGHAPAAQFYQRIVESINHQTAYGDREVFSRSWWLRSVTGVSGTQSTARFRFRSKHGANRLTFVVLMGLAGTSGVNPRCEIDVTVSGGATTTLTAIHYGVTAVAATDAPSEWFWTDRQATIAGATTYEVLIKSIDYGRVLSILAYEESDLTVSEATDYHSALAAASGVPIYDAIRERLLPGLSNMYRHNAGTLIHWAREDGTARTRTSATLINLIDNTTTGSAVTTAPGFYVNATYRNTTSRTTVPFELAVYASIGAGSGTVRLTDTSGTDLITVTINGAAGWYTATGSLPNTDAFYALRFNGDGANAVSVYSASLIEYE